MTDLDDDRMRLFSAVLDDEATPEQHAACRELLQRDPAFAAAYERMKGAESRLAAMYQPATRAEGAARGTRRVPHVRVRLAALAAMVTLVTAAAIFALNVNDPMRGNGSAMHQGFVRNPAPTIVCDTPEKFLAYTREHLGTSIAASFAPGVTLVGWRDAGPGYGEESHVRLLMAYGPSGEPVVVLFQPRRMDRPTLPCGTLKMHSARFGGIEAWEISPLDTPCVLPTLMVVK
jgi:hypothetical protein